MADKKTGNSREQNKEFFVQDFVVCIVDLLGQTEQLKRWSELAARDNIPQPELEDVVGKTSGRVIETRKLFKTYFNGFKTGLLEKEIEHLTENQRNKLDRDYPLSIQCFADTLIFYAPISNDNDDISMRPLLLMLLACGTLMLHELARKVPLRGAITVDSCMELDNEDLYGPALAEAHHLESKVAGYPRIVVSNAAVEFVTASTGFSSVPLIEQLNHDFADQCRKLMCTDSADGQAMVDFLGRQMRTFHASSGYDFPVADAYQFVRSETRRFADSGDKKLHERYQRLLEYMKSRLPLWGLSPEKIGCGE